MLGCIQKLLTTHSLDLVESIYGLFDYIFVFFFFLFCRCVKRKLHMGKGGEEGRAKQLNLRSDKQRFICTNIWIEKVLWGQRNKNGITIQIFITHSHRNTHTHMFVCGRVE